MVDYFEHFDSEIRSYSNVYHVSMPTETLKASNLLSLAKG